MLTRQRSDTGLMIHCQQGVKTSFASAACRHLAEKRLDAARPPAVMGSGSISKRRANKPPARAFWTSDTLATP
jgi:hypothetical protein